MAEKTCAKCERVFRSEEDFLRDTTRWRLCDMGHLWFNCNCNSTLLLPKGSFDWYTPEKFLSPDAKSVFNKLAGLIDNLPHIPNQIMKLQTMLQDEEVDIDKVVSELKLLPFIATEVLKIAENVKASRSDDDKPLESLTHAVVYIGAKDLQDLVVTASLKAIKLETKIFPKEQFWREAFLTGSLAEALAKKFAPDINADECYLAGCLCNLGKLLTAICLPDEADKIYQMITDKNNLMDWRKAERKLKAPNHCLLGEIGATVWGLPDFVRDTANKHHGLSDSVDSPRNINDIVTLANQFTHWLLLQPSRIDDNILNAATKSLRLESRDVDLLVEELLPLRERIVN